jgi:ParB-like chromosome segregation protein Spo0J
MTTAPTNGSAAEASTQKLAPTTVNKKAAKDAVAASEGKDKTLVEPLPYGSPGTADYVELAAIDHKTVKNSRLREPSEKDIELLAKSITHEGLQQYPTAYWDEKRKKVVLLSGFTRRLAFLRNGLTSMPVMFAPKPESPTSARLKNGAENLARRNLEAIEIAAWVGELRGEGVTETEIGRAAGGFSGSSIGNYSRFFAAPFFKDWRKRYEGGAAVPGIRIALDILQHYREDEKAQKKEATRCAELHAEGRPYRVGEADGGEDGGDGGEDGDGDEDETKSSTAARLPLRSPAVVKAALDAAKGLDFKQNGFDAGFYAALRWMSFQRWKDGAGGGHGDKSGPPWEWEPPKRGRPGKEEA